MQIIEKNNTTQAERFGFVLRDLKPDVTSEDRQLAAVAEGITHATIVKYLKGIVENNDRAARLITFFQSRIEEREKVIAK